jgi:protein phosphatase
MDNHSPYWQSIVEHAELTDVGLRRANNQDSMACQLAGNEGDFFRRGHVFVVADGMGRHAAGELASKISVDTIPLEFFKQPNASPPVALKLALEEANRRIHARGGQNPDFKGMGTTTSALALLPHGAIVAHVGYSRVYRLRGNRLEQLTFDHSVVWELKAAAKAGGVEVPNSIPKNYITRSLGHDVAVQIDLEGPFPLAAGDTFFLCSDGLSGQVDDEEIGVILGCLRPDEAVRAFVDLANLRGGPDNITVIAARVNDLTPLENAAAPKTGGGEVSPAIWAGLAAAILLSAMLFFAGVTIGGALAAVTALVIGLFAAVKKTSGGGSNGWRKLRLGRGPHVSVVCTANDAFVAKLGSLLHQLQSSAAQQNWTVDSAKVDQFVRFATAARNVENFPEAVRQYCYALSFLMSEIRRQRKISPPDPLGDAD